HDFRTEDGFPGIDRQRHVYIAALTAKDRIGLDRDVQIEVAAFPAVRSGLALASDADTRAFLNAGGGFDFDRFEFRRRAGTIAGRAGSPAQRAAALTGWAGDRLS